VSEVAAAEVISTWPCPTSLCHSVRCCLWLDTCCIVVLSLPCVIVLVLSTANKLAMMHK